MANEGGGTADQPLTATNVSIKYNSSWGCSKLYPCLIGNSIIFAEGSNKRIRDYQYSWESDSFSSTDLTVFAPNLFYSNPIVDWAYESYPTSVIWCVRDDGLLLALTYYREQQIFGWSTHDTDGIFECAETIRGPDGYDVVFYVVKRYINGQWKRYIEKSHTIKNLDDLSQAFYVDCGLSATFEAPVKHISNLGHLEGKEVVALADGHVLQGLKVVNGSVTLPIAVLQIVIGLPYTAECESLDFTVQSQDSPSVLDRVRKIDRAKFMFESSRGVQAAVAGGEYVNVIPDIVTGNNKPFPLFTGETNYITLPASSEETSRIKLRSTLPLPFILNGIFARTYIADTVA